MPKIPLTKQLNWQLFSEKMGKVFSIQRLHAEVLDWIESREVDTPWFITCSGGSDSVCAVLLLYAHFPHQRDRMHILHFNHRLRNEDSEKDEAFVRDLAANLKITFHTSMMTLKNRRKVNEALAREARLRFFKEEIKKIGGSALFFGHVKEDITETILMRLGRGSGTKGLAAPRPVFYHRDQVVHLRPLLNITKTEIQEYMEENGVPWREDASNCQKQFLRNRLRHSVLPKWRAVEERNIDDGISRTRRYLEEDDKALDLWLDEVGIKPQSGESYNFSYLMDKPVALIRRMLYRWLDAQNLMATLSREAVENLFNSVLRRETLRMSVGDNVFIEFHEDCLQLMYKYYEPEWPSLSVSINSEIFLPHGSCLGLELIEVDCDLRKSIMKGVYDESSYAFIQRPEKSLYSSFEVRQWRAGDRYCPLGAPGTLKLQDLFTDRKISVRERKRLPVVCNDQDEILWIPGLPPANSHRIDNFTNSALRLTYTLS